MQWLRGVARFVVGHYRARLQSGLAFPAAAMHPFHVHISEQGRGGAFVALAPWPWLAGSHSLTSYTAVTLGSTSAVMPLNKSCRWASQSWFRSADS